MRQLFRRNGLSIVLFALFLIFVIAQSIAGHLHYNEEQREHQQATVTYSEYLTGDHFLEALMENWESEFLQMFFFIVLTVFLYQKGSAESKDPDKEEEDVDEHPSGAQNENAPSPVKKGGWILKLYEHSLSLAFLLLFLGSFILHAKGGAGDYNEEQKAHGRAETVTTIEYMATSRFWFESFQNWQSEFLAVGLMVVLTIFLREKGSQESKPVATPHNEHGE